MGTNSLFKYYALDWLAMIFSFIAVYLLGNQKRVGFISFMIANFCWIAVGLMEIALPFPLAILGFSVSI